MYEDGRAAVAATDAGARLGALLSERSMCSPKGDPSDVKVCF